ncbi:hypothetical protein KKE06_03840, partial [Candidatus Micrarchaeota archaeon]|nr:hypothetical protein [Candidatus Micrarchaeota archaeon]MBU1930649.1 hypothetical protein [Candidatus Micrarchaeota archaeon]
MLFCDSNCSDKGFALSLDALLAVILLVSFMSAALVIGFERDITAPVSTLNRLGRDVLVNLDENGLVFELMDQNLSSIEFMNSLEQQVVSLMPSGTHYRLEVEQFDFNATDCQPTQSFEDCFGTGILYPIRGESISITKTLSS